MLMLFSYSLLWMWIDPPHILFSIRRKSTSHFAYKPARLGKSFLFGLSRRSGQTYPLVADRADLRPSTSLLLCFFGFACVARDES